MWLGSAACPSTRSMPESGFGGVEVSEAQKLRALEDENGRLKRLVAELSLDRETLKAAIARVAPPGQLESEAATTEQLAESLYTLALVMQNNVRWWELLEPPWSRTRSSKTGFKPVRPAPRACRVAARRSPRLATPGRTGSSRRPLARRLGHVRALDTRIRRALKLA